MRSLKILFTFLVLRRTEFAFSVWFQIEERGSYMATMKVKCTGGSQLYTLDETARFEITVDGQDELRRDATVNVQLSNDTAIVFQEQVFRLNGEKMPLVVEGTMPIPGFLRYRATIAGDPEPIMDE